MDNKRRPKKKEDNFREWLSDNLRYILLILAIIAVIAIIFFAIKFISSRTSGSTSTASQTESSAEQSTASEVSAAESTESSAATTSELELNSNAEVTTLVAAYYNAISAKDISSLQTLTDSLSDDQAAQITTSQQMTFSDISVYTKPGLEADSYVVFAKYNYKTDSDNMTLPGLSQLYVIKNSEGSYVIKTTDLTTEEQTYIDNMMNDADVKALVAEVNTEYQSAASESETLAQAESIASQTESSEQTTVEASEETTESSDESSEGSTITIKSSCNIRSGPSSSDDIIGEIPGGTTVEIAGEKEGNWLHIKYDEITGYISDKFV